MTRSDPSAARGVTKASLSASPVRLQRSCACGQHTAGGACEECKKKEMKLQRHSDCAATPSVVPPIVSQVLHSPGQPLDDATREFFELRLSANFSGVRVHADAQAAESARSVNARAYTLQNNIVFDQNEYMPGTQEGRRLLAHELVHVVQQGKSGVAGPGITIQNDPASEQEAASAESGAVSGPVHPLSNPNPTLSGGIQRQQSPLGSASHGSSASSAQPCLEAIEGEDVSSLLQAGAVTIIEFGAEWCGPCHMLQASLTEICKEFRKNPPPVPVRFYTIDVDSSANAKTAKEFAGANVPHLYMYVGASQRYHGESAPEPDVLQMILNEVMNYATTSGWWRGAKQGAKWGGIAGGAAGAAGMAAILGGAGGLSGNAQMLAALGSLAGGVAAGMLISGGIGAIVGAVKDDRNTGPRTQQRRRQVSPKLRSNQVEDPLEGEADDLANLVLAPTHKDEGTKLSALSAKPEPASMQSPGESLEPATRHAMEKAFRHDFSGVVIHRDESAAQITQRHDAAALARGSHVYFGDGRYGPYPPASRAVLAHELAHVVQDDKSPGATVKELETEARQASVRVMAGQSADIKHGSHGKELAMTRAEHTAAWSGLGTLGGAALGALGGLGIAAATGGRLGAGALLGGVIGGIAGLVGGVFYGLFKRRTDVVGAAEADTLILRRFGNYLPQGVSQLHNAAIRPVSQQELCTRFNCRHPQQPADCSTLVGWTDIGPEPPQTIDTPENEPVCDKGSRLEHATLERPVIYYATDHRDAAVLVHEGLHAYAHPNFATRLRNFVNEGTTEYFTRQVLADVNMPSVSGYDDNVAAVERFVAIVGEESLKRAFFRGEMDQLDQAARVLGPCALDAWALDLQMNSFTRAQEVLDSRHENHCQGLSSAQHTALPAEKAVT